jgi:hypothetical protein
MSERVSRFKPANLACCASVLDDFAEETEETVPYFIIGGRVFYAAHDMDDRIVDWVEYELSDTTKAVIAAAIRLDSFYPRTGSFNPPFTDYAPLKVL